MPSAVRPWTESIFGRSPASRQHRHKKHERDDRDVLEQEDAQCGPAVDGIDLGSVGEEPEDARGRRECDGGSDAQCRFQILAEEHGQSRAEEERRHYLERSAETGDRAEAKETASGKLQTDREEE